MNLTSKKIIQNIYQLIIVISFCGIFFYSCSKDVSITPPDSPPPDGYVFVNSYPVGFHIYLDSKARRRATPDSLTWLKSGTYQITLKKDLFRDSTFTIDIVEGEKKSVFVDFSQNPSMLGSIYCTSNPAKAEIFLNDSSTGHFTPYTLQNVIPGQYEIKYHLLNSLDDSSTVTVSSGNVSNLQMTLVDTTLWESFTTQNSQIQTNNLSCIAIDKDNVIWIGTYDQGFIKYTGQSWKEYTQSGSRMPDNNVSTIVVDPNTNMKFVGTMRGFVTFDGSNMNSYGFMTSGLPDFYVLSFAFDKSDNWYIGTHAGLTKVDKSGMWSTYGNESVPDQIINSLTVDNNGNLWVGMNSFGVARQSVTGSWYYYTQTANQVISNSITAIASSSFGEIWVGFNKDNVFGSGLSYYNGSSWSNVYTIPASSKTNSIMIDHLNNKWIATDHGLVKFSAPTPSSTTTFTFDNTGLNISNVTGVAEDSYGNIWITTNGGGLIEYKGNH